MVKISCLGALDKRDSYDLLVLPYWEGPVEAFQTNPWKVLLEKPLACGDFHGKMGDQLVLYGDGRVLALGLGKKEAINAEVLRRAFSSAVRFAQSKKIKTLHLIFPERSKISREESLKAIAEGIFLTNYAFSRLKSDLKENPVQLLEEIVFVGVEPRDEALLSKYFLIATAVYSVRDEVNANSDDKTPKMLSDWALSLAHQTSGLKASVLDKKQIEKEKMGLLLAVSRGAAVDPCLITLSYQGNPKSSQHTVLVGKGVTYDTGGLALKSAENMLTMKTDMAGAATVLGVVQTAAALRLKVNVTAVVPATENAIDAKSYKNGDVYRSMSGKSVEITNTDAEGRLILADAITYAIERFHPTEIIDIASLTGGIIVALGEDISGLFVNDERLASDLKSASEATGELLWRMPLHADYKEMLKSEIADIANAAGKTASSVSAALFIQEFTKSVPWAHIDFAGSCYLTKPKFFNPTKATGFGVRLLIDFLERRSS